MKNEMKLPLGYEPDDDEPLDAGLPRSGLKPARTSSEKS